MYYLLMQGRDVCMNFLIDLCSNTEGLGQVVTLLKNVVKVIQWGIPLLLILFGLIDLGKAVMAGKEDEMKKAQGTLIKRFIYAVAAFLVVTLVTFAMGLVGSEDWKNCWNNTGSANIDTIDG